MKTLAVFVVVGIPFSFAQPEAGPSEQANPWGFRVAQLIDAPFAQRLNEKSGSLLEVNATVETGTLIATNEKAKVEMVAESGETFRLGSKSVVVFPVGRHFRMKAGSALLHLPSGSSPIPFLSPLCQVEISGFGALVIQVTGNGGFKAIGLSGEPKVTLTDGSSRLVKPGNLTFVLETPGKFGPVLDIDLLTLVSTSNLISGFEAPLACNGELMQAMLLQRTRIRQRTRAFVGDAKDNQNFQLLNVSEGKGSKQE